MDELLNMPFDWVTDNETKLFNLFEKKHCKMYENELFIDNILPNIVEIETFKIISSDELEKKYKHTKSRLLTSELEENLLSKDNSSYQLYDYEFFLDYLIKKYTVEFNVKLQGLTGESKPYFYIRDINTAIISCNFGREDILNLLSVEGLKLYIYRHIWGRLESSYFTISRISSAENFNKEVQNDLLSRKMAEESAKERIKEIKPQFPIDSYVDIDDEERIIEYYKSLNENQTRGLKALCLNTRGDEALRLVNSYGDDIFSLMEGQRILTLEQLLKSIIVINKYNIENAKIIEEDKKRNSDKVYATLKYTNNFLEYKTLVKEFDKNFRNNYKWLCKFLGIINQGIATYSTKQMSKNTIYSKIVKEISVSLKGIWFVSEVIVFGSVAKGEEKDGSDIDIAFKVGINLNDLTQSRKEVLYKIVKNAIDIISDKYKEQVPGYPKYNYIGTDKFKYPIEKKLIDLLAISFQKKKHIDNYEKVGFFNESKTLFKREQY